MGSHGDESWMCRLCYHPCRVMLSLTPTPMANSFPAYPDKEAERIPLDLQECVNCGHVQLKHQGNVDWDDYRYETPEANRPHLAAAAAELKARYPQAKTVMEIGCNNGLYLEELRKVGFEAYGVDPNTKVGIRAPFTAHLADSLGQVDIIVANNVLAHVDDLWTVFRGIDQMLGMEGVLVFEVQSFTPLMYKGLFDMIYHEHRDYHTTAPLVRFLKQFGFGMEWEDLETHGGSRRYYCERPREWREFARKIADAKAVLQEQICAVEGPIACFGATAKACTLIHHCGLTEVIDYCVDDTPAKQGRYLPGTDIQIHPTSYLEEVPPKAVLMTAWNFKDVLLAKYPHLNWIIPFHQEALCHQR